MRRVNEIRRTPRGPAARSLARVPPLRQPARSSPTARRRRIAAPALGARSSDDRSWWSSTPTTATPRTASSTSTSSQLGLGRRGSRRPTRRTTCSPDQQVHLARLADNYVRLDPVAAAGARVRRPRSMPIDELTCRRHMTRCRVMTMPPAPNRPTGSATSSSTSCTCARSPTATATAPATSTG